LFNSFVSPQKLGLANIGINFLVSRATAEQYDAIQHKGTEDQKDEVAEGEAALRKSTLKYRRQIV
jgi:hypothetical protein